MQIGGTPASGQYGQVAVTGSAALGGDLNVSLVNGFSPSPARIIQVLSFASATGNFAKITGLPSGMTATQTATALDLDTANVGRGPGCDQREHSVHGRRRPVDHGDLAVKDEATTAATGNWQDSVYLSPTPTITASSILLGTWRIRGGLAARPRTAAA